jgi:membrane protein EpsK
MSGELHDTAERGRLPPPRGKLSVNLVCSLLGFAATALIGLWFTRFLIHNLGVEAYGLVPLATMFVSYLSIASLAINSAVGRYLTIALERESKQEASGIFNTALFGNLMLVGVLALPAVLLIQRITLFLDIPSGLERDAVWLVAAAYALFCLTAIANPFDVSTYCRNRFDLRTVLTISSTLVRVAVVFVLFRLGFRRLGFVGWGMLSGGLVYVVLAYAMWRHLTPQLSIRLRDFSAAQLRRLGATSGWVIVNQVGAILFLNLDILLLNRLLGAESAGTYAIPLQLVVFLRGLAAAASTILGPAILYRVADEDWTGLVRLSKQATRFVGLVLALPIGLILGFAQPLLRIWLGEGYATIAPLLAVMVCYLPVNMAVYPLFYAQIATNKVKVPALVTLFMGGANLLLAVCFVLWTPLGVFGIPIAGAIMLTAKNAIFTPIYVAYITEARRSAYLWEITLSALASGLVAVASYTLQRLWFLASLPQLVAAGAVVMVLYAFVAYYVFLGQEDRKQLVEMVRRALR